MGLRLLLGSAAGIIVTFALWRWLATVIAVEPSLGIAERLGLGCAALLPAVAMLNLMIAAQMLIRTMTRAVDPLAGEDGRLLRVNQRALTNTVEQLAGFAPALLALATGVSGGLMPYVIAAGIMFALARLVFWGGYLLGPMLRAPGMAATFAINVTTMIAAVAAWWP
jgi:uncharacterized membrane protein YecN with MAPEG domain